MVVNIVFLSDICAKVLSDVACFWGNQKIVSFVSLVFNKMLQSETNNSLRSSISKIIASVDNIDAHINRIDDGVKLRQVILLREGAFVCPDTNRTYFEVFVLDEFLKVHKVEFIHELFAFIFPKRSV